VSGSAEGKGQKGGRDKDEEDEEEADKILADASLFATWDYDPKDFRGTLPAPRRGSKVGAPAVPSSLKRKRSESVVPGRRASDAGYGLL